MHSLISVGLFVYISIRSWLAIHWLRFCRWIVQPVRLIRPTSEFSHKIVVIGDGFAEGFGGNVTVGHCGGISHYLSQMTKKEPKIRHKWQILNRGVTGTTSSDWAPNSSTNLFKLVFTNPSFKDANIVIVIVGSMDAKQTPNIDAQTTMDNLRDICDSLKKKDKIVVLSTLGNAGLDTTGEIQHKRNKLIKEYCHTVDGEDTLLLSQLSSPGFRKHDILSFDGIHPNTEAYKRMAREAFFLLLDKMVAVEWDTWKKKLDEVKYDASLYH